MWASYENSWVQINVNTNFERKNINIFFSMGLNICFGCSKEPSHRDGSFEYPQHMFWLRNKKNNFQLHTLNLRPADGCHDNMLALYNGVASQMQFHWVLTIRLYFAIYVVKESRLF